MVSIKDIAKKAGVSISTVSYALNGSPKVTEETSAKILAIAKELNYVPNAAARTLKKRKTKIIGAFLNDYGGPFFGELLHGMRTTLKKKGYDLVACTGKESHRFLPQGIIDGAIVLDDSFPDEDILNYAERGHKLVVLDREMNHSNIEKVLLDNRTGVELALDHLIQNDHKNIILVTGNPLAYDAKQRKKEAIEFLDQHPDVHYHFFEGYFDRESGERAAKHIIEHVQGEVAVFCFNDEMAVGLYNYLEQTSYAVGDNISLVGFDNIEISAYLRPRLTTIHYSKKDWGALAAEQLIRLISNKPTSPQKIPVELLVGDSVHKLT